MRKLAFIAAALAAACASETWDNRFDPEASAYRAPCDGAPADLAGQCVLYEDFDAGLDRWRAGAAPAGVEPVRYEPGSPDGVAGVVRLPACTGGAPEITIELDQPAGPLALEVVWRAEDPAAGALELALFGVGADAVVNTADAAAPAGWRLTQVNFSGAGAATLFGVRCAPAAVYLDRIALRTPAP